MTPMLPFTPRILHRCTCLHRHIQKTRFSVGFYCCWPFSKAASLEGEQWLCVCSGRWRKWVSPMATGPWARGGQVHFHPTSSSDFPLRATVNNLECFCRLFNVNTHPFCWDVFYIHVRCTTIAKGHSFMLYHQYIQQYLPSNKRST